MYLHKGVEVPAQNIEEPERYLAQIHRDLRAVRNRRDVKADSFTLWFYQTSSFHFLSYRARKKKYNWYKTHVQRVQERAARTESTR